MIQSETGKSIEMLFELSIANEYKAAQLYEKFSKFFGHVATIKKLWSEMHAEEISHAITLQNIRKTLSLTQLTSKSTNEITESVMKTKKLLENCLDRSINTLDDAYKCAEEIELCEINWVFKFLASELIPYDQHEEVITDMITKHTRKILDFNQTYGNQDWRKRIKRQSN